MPYADVLPAAHGQPTVTVIGCGPMGAAIARALLAQGHSVVVWNRTAERARDLVASGATLAPTAAAAIASTSLTLVCVRDHAATMSILDSPGVAPSLAGRTLVQMTTVATDQVAELREFTTANGGRFIMGCISAYPDMVGRSDAFYLYAGDRPAYEAHIGALAGLGGTAHWLGDDPRAVPAAYSSFGTYALGAFVLFLEGAALARHFGIPIAEYRDLACSVTALVLDRIRDSSTRIEQGNFAGDHASVDTTLAAVAGFTGEFRRAGVDAKLAHACTAQLAMMSKRGDGAKDVAFLAEALLADRTSARP